MVNYSKLKVMVVDDEKIITTILYQVLKDLGVGVVKVFNTPKAANDSLKDFVPNVILSDIEMGETDGFQFINEAREEFSHTKHAAVVFLTGHSSPDFIKKAKQLRVAGYLLKPVQPEKLRVSLDRIYAVLLSSGRL